MILWVVAGVLFSSVAPFVHGQSSTKPIVSKSGSNPDIDLVLRIVWGGERPSDYVGRISLDAGTMECVQRLGIESGDVSIFVVDDAKSIRFNDSNVRFGGCDLHIHSPSTSKLTVQFESESSNGSAKSMAWGLSDLVDKPVSSNLADGVGRVAIDRAPGDRIRIQTNRKHFVYDPKESLDLSVAVHELPWHPSTAILETKLTRVVDGEIISSGSQAVNLDARGNSESVEIRPLQAPDVSGVYELSLSVAPKRAIASALQRTTPVRRVVQFVVAPRVSSTAPIRNWSDEWKPIDRIRTDNLQVLSTLNWDDSRASPERRFRIARMLFPFATKDEPLRSTWKDTLFARSKSNPSIAGHEQLEIPSSQRIEAKLTNLTPNILHRVRIRSLANDSEGQVRIVEMEKGNRDRLLASESITIHQPIASKLNAVLETEHEPASAQAHTTDILFWPNDTVALLELSNTDPCHVWSIESIHIEQHVGRRSSEVPLNRESARGGREVSSALHDTKKLSSIQLNVSNLRQWFGTASKGTDFVTERHYDDWHLFYENANRLAEYCQAMGYDAVRLTVFADGCGLYPSSVLTPNRRWDTGTFFNDGRDPIQKDIVELMYRILGQHGIELVPVFEFSSPIAEIERLRHQRPIADLFQSNEEVEPGSFSQSAYNPLSPPVQRAIAKSIQEFQDRYGKHSNFSGIAIDVERSRHLSLDAPLQDINESLIQRFSEFSQGTIPALGNERKAFVAKHAPASFANWYREQVDAVVSKWESRKGVETVRLSDDPSLSTARSTVSNGNKIGGNRTPYHDQLRDLVLDQPHPIRDRYATPPLELDPRTRQLRRLIGRMQHFKTERVPFEHGQRLLPHVAIYSGLATQSTSSHEAEEAGVLLFVNAGAMTERLTLQWSGIQHARSIVTTQSYDPHSENLIAIDPSNIVWELNIPPSTAVLIELENAPSKIEACYRTPMDRTYLQRGLQCIEQAIGRLSMPQPNLDVVQNRDFEAPHADREIGRVLGWTMSTIPGVSVGVQSTIDDPRNHCLRVESTNETQTAWIQSDPFPIALPKQLALGMRVRRSAPIEQLGVSLWVLNAQRGQFDRLASYDLLPVVPADSYGKKWHDVVWNLNDQASILIESSKTAVLRIQIEVRGEGTVSIDDVFLSSAFLQEGERRELRSKLFLAKQSLESGDDGPAQDLISRDVGDLLEWCDVAVARRDQARAPYGPEERANLKNEPPGRTQGDLQSIDPQKPTLKPKRRYWWQRS